VNYRRADDVYSKGLSELTLGESAWRLGINRTEVVGATKSYLRTGPGRDGGHVAH
jgi:hypothetical protein